MGSETRQCPLKDGVNASRSARGELRLTGNIARFHEWNARIFDDAAFDVRHAKRIRSGAHTFVVDEVIVIDARYIVPNPVGRLPFELGNGMAMIANLHRAPPLIRAFFEVIHDGARDVARDELPGYRNAAVGERREFLKGVGRQIDIAVFTFGAQIDDAHRDFAIRALNMGASAADPGIGVIRGVHGSDEQWFVRRGAETARPVARCGIIGAVTGERRGISTSART